MIKVISFFAAVVFLAACQTTIGGATSGNERINVSLPNGGGPFSAVILMHWTNGVGSAERTWTKRLNDAGVAAVILESYRRIDSGLETRVKERVVHLQEAIAFVKTASWSNGEISVLGRSHGAWAVIDALRSGAMEGKLVSAVAVSPYCGRVSPASSEWTASTPLLIVIGNDDRVISPSECLSLADKLTYGGRSVVASAFAGGHSVDIESDEASQRIMSFLLSMGQN